MNMKKEMDKALHHDENGTHFVDPATNSRKVRRKAKRERQKKFVFKMLKWWIKEGKQ